MRRSAASTSSSATAYQSTVALAYAIGARVQARCGALSAATPKTLCILFPELDREVKVREGSYFPSLLEPRRRSEKALLAVIQQAYVEGVSTRRVDDLIKSLGCDGISKSQVSRICA